MSRILRRRLLALVLLVPIQYAAPHALAQADNAATQPIAANQPSTLTRPSIDAAGQRAISDALAKAVAENKLLVVKLRTSWCMVSDEMDRVTWSSNEVTEWCKDNAHIIDVNIDDSPSALGVTPILVLYRDGVEFDRTVGRISRPTALACLKDARAGKSKLEIARVRAASVGGTNMFQRLRDIVTLMDAGEHDAASPHLVELWNSTYDARSLINPRDMFVLPVMRRACAEHEATRQTFVRARDDRESRLKTAPNLTDLDEWLLFNGMVEETDKSLEWFDRVKATKSGKRTIRSVAHHIEPLVLIRVRKAPETLRDLSILNSPLGYRHLGAKGAFTGMLERVERDCQHLPPEDLKKALSAIRDTFFENFALVHAALIVDGRGLDALTYRNDMTERIGSPHLRLRFIETALDHVPDRTLIRSWAIPYLGHIEFSIPKETDEVTNADLAARAAAARKALSE